MAKKSRKVRRVVLGIGVVSMGGDDVFLNGPNGPIELCQAAEGKRARLVAEILPPKKK